MRDVGFTRKFFEEMPEKDPIAWNAMIYCYAQVGESKEALELFHLMQLEGAKINAVSMISDLSACTQLGALDQGRWAHSYIERNKIKITVRLGTTLVDLYAKCGDMEILWGLEQKNVYTWSSALNGFTEKFLELYLSFGDSDNWDKISHVRQSMKSRGVRKEPGCSVVEVNGEVHEFFVGDKSHPRYTEIEAFWKEISRRLRLAGYKADTSPVMVDIDKEEKEDALCLHSEKAAIALDIMSLKEDVPIMIVKNLRVCGDCHQVSMMISKIFDREIIVRDRNRFHHFKDGHCSCNGFW